MYALYLCNQRWIYLKGICVNANGPWYSIFILPHTTAHFGILKYRVTSAQH